MNNIAQERLIKIADETKGLINEINEGVKWSDSYLKEEYQEETSYALKTYRRKLKKIKAAITQQPVIALFGASQVGKSYLVKNILSDKGNYLNLPDHRNKEITYEFIKDLNPEGDGSEATSVVTRFTYDEKPDMNKPPVKIKILSAKDLIIIFADSYLSDFKRRKADLKTDEVMEFLEILPSYFSSDTQNYLDEDDVYDIQDYLTKFFEANFRMRLETFTDSKFWHKIAGNIHKINFNNWGKVFEILWGNQQKITDLFNGLIRELNNIEFSKVIYSDFDAVLREKKTILDVARLKELMTNKGNTINVQNIDGQRFSVFRNNLCALTAEVILNISKASVDRNDFIKNIDILDFPGARTRLKLDETEGLSDENISGMVLRGKVAYLFNSYSLNYEISNLFVCTHSKQSNVRDLPELVNNWIEYNIGSNPQERRATLSDFAKPPLFLIFTWWNMQLTFDTDKDIKNGIISKENLQYKWELRFDKLIKEEIFGEFKWHKEWTGKPSKFNNCYLLRDYKYSKDVFTGYEEKNIEDGIVKKREEYYEAIKKSFKSSSLVNDFFSNTEKVWNETSTVGNDGSKYIIDNIKDIANNKIRTKRYLKIINDAKDDTEKKLNEHYHSDKADEQIRKASRDGADMQMKMNKVFGVDAFNFGNFIEHLTISEKEIYEFYHKLLNDVTLVEKQATNPYILYRESSPRLSTENNYEENLEILRQDYHRDTLEETKEYFKSEGINLNELFYGELHDLKNKSTVLAEKARDYWFKTKLNIDNFNFFVNLGFDKSLIIKLFENLKTNFNKLKLTEVIARNIRDYVDRYNKVDKAQDMIAHITAGIINEFINSVGWTFFSDAEKEKIKEADKSNNIRLIFPEETETFEAVEEDDVVELFEMMEELNKNLNKRPIDFETIKNVPMIKNYRRWRELLKISFVANCDIPTYNVEANKQIGEILKRVRMYNFSI